MKVARTYTSFTRRPIVASVTLAVLAGCEATPEGEETVTVVEGMVEVPEGPFWRGCSEEVAASIPIVWCESGPEYLAQNVPLRVIHLSRFWIDQYEATIGEYVACYEAGVCEGCGSRPDVSLEFS